MKIEGKVKNKDVTSRERSYENEAGGAGKC